MRLYANQKLIIIKKYKNVSSYIRKVIRTHNNQSFFVHSIETIARHLISFILFLVHRIYCHSIYCFKCDFFHNFQSGFISIQFVKKCTFREYWCYVLRYFLVYLGQKQEQVIKTNSCKFNFFCLEN